jgi:hypothetical protein
MDYDRSIHNNPHAQAWAKFFIETTKDKDRELFGIEGYMIAWFSNAMMAMHNHLYKTEIKQLREALREIYEVYAGSEGIPQPMTAAEGYLLFLLKETAKIAQETLQEKE